MNNRPFIAVRALISDEDGKILLLKRTNTIYGNGKWCLPGGKIEYGQKAERAVINEVKQETSLIVTELKFILFLENIPSEESDLHYINLVFLCRTEGDIRLNDESSDHAWIGRDEMPNFEIAFRNDIILNKYWDGDY